MHQHLRPLLALVVFALSACQGQNATPSLDTETQKASYGIGLQMGGQLQPAQSRIEMDALLAGLRDGMAGNEPQLPQEELQTALESFSQAVNEEMTQRRNEEAQTNMAEAESFLEENAGKEGVMVTESGLQYEIVEQGEGDSPGPESQVTIQYRGTLMDGTEFDSSYQRGEPAQFNVGGVIPGLAEGLQLMEEGATYKFYIPPALAYGPQGAGTNIPPNALLTFEVELIEVGEGGGTGGSQG